jgi:CRISPR system Cascade subunit CasB
MKIINLVTNESEMSKVFWNTIEEWWRDLDNDRGARARLRRAKTPDEVFVSSDFQRGIRSLLESAQIRLNHDEAFKLALAIGVLVYSKTPNRKIILPKCHFARQISEKDQGRDTLKDTRFRKLLATTDDVNLFVRLRRLVSYLGDYPEYKSLICGASNWTEQTRRDWGVNYYYKDPQK